MKTSDWVMLGALAGVAYIVYEILNSTNAALSSVGNAIGSGLYEAFNPNAAGQLEFYTATFPDGSSHAIAAGLIQMSTGTFTIPSNDSSGVYVTPAVSAQYGGNTYQLVQSTSGSGYAAVQTGSAAGGSSTAYTPGASIATDVYGNLLAAGV